MAGIILELDDRAACENAGTHKVAPRAVNAGAVALQEVTLMDENQPNVEYGYCECGCGRRAPVATYTTRRKGWVKGQPKRFIHGHNKTNLRDLTGAWLVDDQTGCWLWQRAIHHTGYGIVGGGSAHRLVYELHRGPIPNGLHLDHLCRTKHCVNPDHLEPVTNAENCRRGANAILTMADADRIRALLATDITGRAIATQFGVSESTVSLIKRGRIWT